MKTIEDLDQGTIRRIDWQELFPGVLLFRALTLALRIGPIFAGAFFVTFCAWLALSLSFVSSFPAFDQAVFSSLTDLETFSNQTTIGSILKQTIQSTVQTPFRIFGIDSQTEPSRFLISFIPSLFLGIFFGLFLSRKAAVRLASTERSSFGETFRFACRRYQSVVLAGLIPILGVASCALVLFLLSRSETLFCVTSPISFLVSLIAVLTGLGLLLGAPLLTAAVATDQCDGFDAFSRTFSYLHQRPFHFVFYSASALVFGWIGYEIVQFLVVLLIQVLGFFASNFLMIDLQKKPSFFLWLALTVAAPTGFWVSYYFIASTAIYFILRRSVDGIAFDHFAKTKKETAHRLKPILSDPEGGPVMAGGDDPIQTGEIGDENSSAASTENGSKTAAADHGTPS